MSSSKTNESSSPINLKTLMSELESLRLWKQQEEHRKELEEVRKEKEKLDKEKKALERETIRLGKQKIKSEVRYKTPSPTHTHSSAHTTHTSSNSESQQKNLKRRDHKDQRYHRVHQKPRSRSPSPSREPSIHSTSQRSHRPHKHHRHHHKQRSPSPYRESSFSSSHHHRSHHREPSIYSNQRSHWDSPPPRHHRSHRHHHHQEKQTHKDFKLSLPHFLGKDDVEAYLDWEMKVEQIFTCHQVQEENKVQLATLSFQGFALCWWTATIHDRRRHGDPPIEYWNDLKTCLRKRHVPSYYEREVIDKLQRLRQGNLSVEEYRQTMELQMMRIGLREDEQVTLSRFLNGLNFEIRDKVELLPYRNLDELAQLCLRIEKQNKRTHSSIRQSIAKKESKREGTFSKPSLPSHSNQNQKENKNLENPSSDSTKSSNIKCFKCLGRGHIASQCPTKKTMVLKGLDYYSSQDETTSSTSSSEAEDGTSPEQQDIFPCEGEILVSRRLLGSKSCPLDQSQRGNIFHSRCQVLNKTCSLIVDSGSCTNCCSTRLATKLNLSTSPHPQPYNLSWLNDNEDLVVDKQVNVKFSIGPFEDEVLCDLVPMEACHLLLGRPWQFDRHTTYHGFSNTISLNHKGKQFMLHPLSPSQVAEDQQKLKQKKAQEKKTQKLENQKSKQKGKEACIKQEQLSAPSSSKTLLLMPASSPSTATSHEVVIPTTGEPSTFHNNVFFSKTVPLGLSLKEKQQFPFYPKVSSSLLTLGPSSSTFPKSQLHHLSDEEEICHPFLPCAPISTTSPSLESFCFPLALETLKNNKNKINISFLNISPFPHCEIGYPPLKEPFSGRHPFVCKFYHFPFCMLSSILLNASAGTDLEEDPLDLRTNPSQGGGDGVAQGS